MRAMLHASLCSIATTIRESGWAVHDPKRLRLVNALTGGCQTVRIVQGYPSS